MVLYLEKKYLKNLKNLKLTYNINIYDLHHLIQINLNIILYLLFYKNKKIKQIK